MIGLAKEAPRRQDRRGLWDNSPELRESVKEDLQEWGQAQRGGMPDLGYPHEQPFSTTPSKMPPVHNIEKVQAITDTLTMWRLILRELPRGEQKSHLLRLLVVIKVHFISDRPAEAKAKQMGVSRRTFWRIVDEAAYRFWVLHY